MPATFASNISAFPNVAFLNWTGLGDAETGAAAEYPQYGDKTIHFSSSAWNGATVKLQGSNDGVTWVDLKDIYKDTITTTAANAIFILAACPRFIRPVTSGGTSAVVDCLIVAGRKR